jgi:hypothetical protein
MNFLDTHPYTLEKPIHPVPKKSSALHFQGPSGPTTLAWIGRDNLRTCAVALLAVSACYILETTEAYAVAGDLRAPMTALKTTIFGGWLWGVKVVAVAVGSAFAVAQQTITPFGIGAGIGAGIHFFDAYLGDGGAILI